MINTKLQNIIDTKSAIGNAINNKGGSITSETPFYEYAPAIENISTGGGAYSTFVAQAQDNSLYTVYNGYDSITNPTPNLSNNFAFNQWLLNNSATGDIVLSNVVVEAGGNFNGPNVSFNEANLSFVNNTANYGGTIFSVTTNNGFIYAGGGTNLTVQKFHESNLAFVGNTANYGAIIEAITTNDGFIYVGGRALSGTNRGVSKFYESNLALVGNTANYGGIIYSVTTNNGFVYAGGQTNQTVQKFHESNLAFVGNTPNLGGAAYAVTTNNGFIYATAFEFLGKYYESNLALVSNAAVTGVAQTITTNNGFVYIVTGGGFPANTSVSKYYESNLAFVSNTANYGGTIESVTTNNGFIYAGGDTNRTVKKFEEAGLTPENITFYNITNIKE
jgi:hypothetical protein